MEVSIRNKADKNEAMGVSKVTHLVGNTFTVAEGMVADKDA
jgi:hypothetical protein